MSSMLKALKQLKAKGVTFSQQTSTADDGVSKSPHDEALAVPVRSPRSDDATHGQAVDPSITVLVGERPIAEPSVEVNGRIEDTWQHLTSLIESEPEGPDFPMPDSSMRVMTDDGSGDTAQILVIDESGREDTRPDSLSGTEPQADGDKTRTDSAMSDQDAIIGDTDSDDGLDVASARRSETQTPDISEPEDCSPAMTLILSDLDTITSRSDGELQHEDPPIPLEKSRLDGTPDSKAPTQPLVPTELHSTTKLVLEEPLITGTGSDESDPRTTIPITDNGPLSPPCDGGWGMHDDQLKSRGGEESGEPVGETLPVSNQRAGLDNPPDLDGGTDAVDVGADVPVNPTLVVDDVETLASLTRLDPELPQWREPKAEESLSEPDEGLDDRHVGPVVDTVVASPAPSDASCEPVANTERFTLHDVDSSDPPPDPIESFPVEDSPNASPHAGSVPNGELDSATTCDAVSATDSEVYEAESALTSQSYSFRPDETHDEVPSSRRSTSGNHERSDHDDLSDVCADVVADPKDIGSTAPAGSDVAELAPSCEPSSDLSHPMIEFARLTRDRLADDHVQSQYADTLQKIRSAFPQGLPTVIVLIGADEEDHVTDASACLASTVVGREAGEVLLVDANFPKRTLTKRLGYENAPGLADICEGIVTWHEAIVDNAGEKNLSILPGGGWLTPMKTTAVVMRPLLAEWKKRFQTILVDAGSTGTMLADALCTTADATYLLVRLGQTERRQAEKAAAKLRSGAKLSGCIVTNAPPAIESDGADQTAKARENSHALSWSP